MKCTVGFLAFAVLCLLMQDGSGQSDRRQQYLEKQQQRLGELSRACSSFGMSLYRQLSSRSDGNVIFSPFSIFTALSMTLLGTDGSTKRELRTVMAQRSHQGVHQALRAVIDDFPSSGSANVTLRVANAIYYDSQRMPLLQSFIDNVRRLYEASPRPFQRPNPETDINLWISRATGGKIRDFYNPGDISADHVLLLLNAVYFQGTWKNIFNEDHTRERDFITASGDVVRVPMMSRDGAYSVKALEGDLAARVLELPFGTDDRFSLFILLPDSVDGLPGLEARLDSQVLENAVTNMPQAYRYEIQVPRFTLREKTSMKEMLQAMGLSRLFTNQADLSRMSVMRTKVADVKHEAVLEVDEKGAIAAAVTGVQKVAISMPPRFAVDHPFLAILRDKTTRLNLFLGRVHDPSQ